MAKLPQDNISVTLVKNTLGEGSSDIGTLCKSSKVNMWSKWKPISYNTITLTEDVLKSSNYGITIIQDFLNTYDHSWISGRKWIYNKPTGGRGSAFRLGDFRNYQHIARNLFQPIGDQNILVNKIDSSTKTFYLDINMPSDGGVTVYHVTTNGYTYIKDCYFGLVLWNISKKSIDLIATSQWKIESKLRLVLNADFERINGLYIGGFFLSDWKLEKQLTYPTDSQIPSAPLYFLHNEVVHFNVDNMLGKYTFPYTLWSSRDFYQPINSPAISYDTTMYTYKSSNIHTGVVPGGPVGRREGYVYFDGKGYITLTPTDEMMDEFTSYRKTIEIEVIEGSFSDYCPDLIDGDSLLKTIIDFTDIDNERVSVCIRYEYFSNQSGDVWYPYLFISSPNGYQETRLPEYIIAPNGNSFFTPINKIRIENGYSDIGFPRELTVTAFDDSGNRYSVIGFGGGITNLSQIRFGGEGEVINNNGYSQHASTIPRGSVYIDFWSESL